MMSEMRHAMAEQDAAILDYLDGLLRESEVVGSVANLTLVSSSSALGAIEQDEESSEVEFAEEEAVSTADFDLEDEGASAEELLAVAASEAEMVEGEPMAEVLSQDAGSPTPASAEPMLTDSFDVPVQASGDQPLAAELEADAPISEMEEAFLEPPAPVVDETYLILTVGSIKLAFPRDEVAATLQMPQIEPLRGAPEQVAGVVEFDGKRRMLLSLAPVVIGHAAVPQNQTVLMLGGGLWGVAGGPVIDGLTIEPDRIKWRSPSERHGARPWLAGLSRADGVAIVDTAALRRALSGNS